MVVCATELCDAELKFERLGGSTQERAKKAGKLFPPKPRCLDIQEQASPSRTHAAETPQPWHARHTTNST